MRKTLPLVENGKTFTVRILGVLPSIIPRCASLSVEYEGRPLKSSEFERCPGDRVVCGIRAAVDDFLGGVRRIILACCRGQ